MLTDLLPLQLSFFIQLIGSTKVFYLWFILIVASSTVILTIRQMFWLLNNTLSKCYYEKFSLFYHVFYRITVIGWSALAVVSRYCQILLLLLNEKPKTITCQFSTLPRVPARRYASGVFATSTCLSVRLSQAGMCHWFLHYLVAPRF